MSNKKNFMRVFPVKKSPKVKTVRNATSDYSGVIEESKGFGLIDPAGQTIPQNRFVLYDLDGWFDNIS